jgi:hypothetical protein
MAAKKSADLTVVEGPITSQSVAPHQPEGATILAMIDKIAGLPNVDPQQVLQLYEIHQRMQADAARKAFMVAFSECQKEMAPIARDAVNPQTRSKYATHAQLDGALRPIYTKHGFGVSFNTGLGDGTPIADNHVRILLDLSHRGGHERHYQVDMPNDGKGAKGNDVMTKTHAQSSAFTYGRRNLEVLAFNIATVDDDGNAASRPQPLITDAQADVILGLLSETNTEPPQFFAWAKVESVSDIRACDFEKVIGLLKAKRAKMAKGDQ